MIGAAITYIVRFIPLLLSTLITFFSLLPATHTRLNEEIDLQLNHIASLEEDYSNGKIAPVDETEIFDGDLNAELDAGIKFNEISFIATHNSYQTPSTKEYKKIFSNLDKLTFGLVNGSKTDFWSESLTDQLNCGIRSLEMDVEVFDRNGEISFTCMHSPNFDMTTSCYDFSLGLKEIAMWSDNNPNHLPVTIIVEPKQTFLPMKDMKALNVDYAKELDKMLRETLGEKLFTPADMLRDFGSFGEMRAADDWCEVKDMLGKVLILLHEGNVTENYINIDPSIKSQAMFPMLRPKDAERDCTSFILCNKPEELLEINDYIIKEKKIIVRTRTDKFTEVTQSRLENAMKSDAHIVSTDFPIRTDLTPDSYVVTFNNGKTVRKTG